MEKIEREQTQKKIITLEDEQKAAVSDKKLVDQYGNEIVLEDLERKDWQGQEKDTQAQDKRLNETVVQKERTPEELKQELEAMIKKITFVDVTQLAESEARDVAEEKLTEEREESRGMRNFFKRVWRHNIAREYYRQKEIAEAKATIYEKQNIYAGEETNTQYHEAAMKAITHRFLSEYESLVRSESGEAKKTLEKNPEVDSLQNNIKTMIEEYAGGIIDDATFDSERDRILSTVTELGKGTVGEGRLYADNLKEVAQQVKQAVAQGVALKSLDLNFDLSVGRATSAIKTEGAFHTVDRLISKVNGKLAGTLLANETTIASAVAVGTIIAGTTLKGGLRTGAKIFGFAGGAFVSGALRGAKENLFLKNERALHQRERAKGKVIGKDAPRREQMEKYRYETESAEDMTVKLLASLYVDGDHTKGLKSFEKQEDLECVLGNVSVIEGRINGANRHHIDLISYSNVREVEIERTRLEIELARAKALLSKLPVFESKESFESFIAESAGTYEKSVLTEDIQEKDRQFNKMKRKAVAKACLKGAVSAVLVGGMVHEATAFLDNTTDGAVERLVKGSTITATHTTPIETLREWMQGNSGIPPTDLVQLQQLKEVDLTIGTEHFRFPEGTQLLENTDGTVSVVIEGKTIADHIPFQFGADGVPTQETLAALEDAHILPAGFTSIPIIHEDGGSQTPKEYLGQHSEGVHHMKRDLWYDNDTPKPTFDKNELRLDWGGVHNSGIDANGNYVFDISRMTDNGSFHGALSAEAKELAEKGQLVMLLSLSKDTQNQVFEVPIDLHGNAIIDPHSEVGKLFFSEEGGKAVFNGQYAEVAQIVSSADGTEHARILSTLVGEGVDAISAPDSVPETIQDFVFDQKRDIDLPPAIPLTGRFPLEPVSDAHKKQSEKSGDQKTDGKKDKDEANGPNKEKQLKKEEKNTETKPISQKEYDALKRDLELINKRIQESGGVITFDQDDFQSKHARLRYADLGHISPTEKPVTFNRSELQTMGNELESILVTSSIEKEQKKNKNTSKKEEESTPQTSKKKRLTQEDGADESKKEGNKSDEALLERYFLEPDATEKEKQAFYERSHTKKDSLKQNFKEALSYIKSIKEAGKEKELDELANALVDTLAKNAKAIGLELPRKSKGKAWAYYNIATNGYNAQNPAHEVPDPLQWKDKRNRASTELIQRILDGKFGEEVYFGVTRDDVFTKKFLMGTIKVKTVENKKQIRKFNNLVEALEENEDTQKDFETDKFMQLGRLVRENLTIQEVTPS